MSCDSESRIQDYIPWNGFCVCFEEKGQLGGWLSVRGAEWDQEDCCWGNWESKKKNEAFSHIKLWKSKLQHLNYCNQTQRL